MTAFSDEQLEQLKHVVRTVVREELERLRASAVDAKTALPSPLSGFGDVHAAAKLFKTSYSTVREWILQGDAPATEVAPSPRSGHRRWRVDFAEMDAWIRAGGVDALAAKKKANEPTPERLAAARAHLEERARRKGFASAREWLNYRARSRGKP